MTRIVRFTKDRCAICARRAGLRGLRVHGNLWLCWRCEARWEAVLGEGQIETAEVGDARPLLR